MQNFSSYIIETFFKVYNIKKGSYDILYSKNGNSKVNIVDDGKSFFDSKIDLDFSKIIWKEWKNIKIPFFFNANENEIYSCVDGIWKINFDIIAASFYFLSGWQEYTSKEKDSIGRFPYEESIQRKLDIIEIPVVNYYFDILKTVIEKAYSVSLNSHDWKKHEFAACITHDIDKCNSAWLEGSFSELKKGKILSPIKLVFKRFFCKDAWFNFDKINEIEKKFNTSSSFYFLPYNKKRNGLANADYDVKNKKIKKEIEKIIKNGSEAGIHGSVGTHNNFDDFKKDLLKLDRKITGNRFHFLQFEINKTPQILEKAGIKYDSTLYFAEHIGFRNSFCHPFYLFDIENDRATDVLEIPLNVMDGTLAMEKYMKVGRDEAVEKVFKLIQEIKKFNGCFTLLWHNTYYSEYKYSGWCDVLIKILNYCKQENSCFANGEEVLKIYTEHGS